MIPSVLDQPVSFPFANLQSNVVKRKPQMRRALISFWQLLEDEIPFKIFPKFLAALICGKCDTLEFEPASLVVISKTYTPLYWRETRRTFPKFQAALVRQKNAARI